MKYSKYFLFLGLSALLITSCHTTQKVSGRLPKSTVNNVRWTARKLSKTIQKHQIDFHTLSARIAIDFDNGKRSYHNVTAYLRMKKDSIIWLSVRPVLGIEMVRLEITPDSIKMRNNLKGKLYVKSAKNMAQILHVPFNFSALESLLLGSPAFIPRKIKHFKSDTTGVYVTLYKGPMIFKYKWKVDPFLLKNAHFQVSNYVKTARQILSDYHQFSVGSFSLQRNIHIQSSHPIKIHITFNKIKFNVPVKFPFH